MYRLRRLPHCRVIALGPHPRRMTPSDEGTASTLTDAAERGLPVEVADIFALLAGRRVDLPKLDVEGGEYELLEDPRFAALVPPALLLERLGESKGRQTGVGARSGCRRSAAALKPFSQRRRMACSGRRGRLPRRLDAHSLPAGRCVSGLRYRR